MLSDICAQILALGGAAMPSRGDIERECRLCHETKPMAEFRVKRRVCKACDPIDQRQRKARRGG